MWQDREAFPSNLLPESTMMTLAISATFNDGQACTEDNMLVCIGRAIPIQYCQQYRPARKKRGCKKIRPRFVKSEKLSNLVPRIWWLCLGIAKKFPTSMKWNKKSYERDDIAVWAKFVVREKRFDCVGVLLCSTLHYCTTTLIGWWDTNRGGKVNNCIRRHDLKQRG